MKKEIISRTLPGGETAPFAKGEICSPQQLIQQLYALRGFHSQGESNSSSSSLNAPRHSDVTNESPYELTHLLSPKGMLGLDTAASRLATAVEKNEKILIVGDFDADGATSTALCMRAFNAFGSTNVQFLVPNRFEFGYGLTPEIVEVAKQLDPKIILTVDNGIASVDGVDLANSLGLEVIVTDHHLPPSKLPNATAIVNPNQVGCEFPSKNLAGVGVAFYVLCAVRKQLQNIKWFEQKSIARPNMASFLDLVALGTVADVVPLDYNNRILVYQGLKRIRAQLCCQGVSALFQVAAKDITHIGSQDLGFIAGPRLNAAGRLDDMSLGIDLLLEDNPSQALYKAGELDALNKERRQIEGSMQVEANQILADTQSLSQDHLSSASGICLYRPDWHQGVIGILASRIKDKLHKPTIVFAQTSDTEIKGSGRSIEGVHMRDVLDYVATSNPGLLSKFGGHAMAAGLTLKAEDLSDFEIEFAKGVEHYLAGKKLTPSLVVDGKLPAQLMTLPAAEAIGQAGPWGQNFLEPVFYNEFSIISQKIVGQKHLKLVLSPISDPNVVLDAIAFSVDLTIWPADDAQRVKMAYSLDVNVFRGRSSVQLKAAYMEPM